MSVKTRKCIHCENPALLKKNLCRKCHSLSLDVQVQQEQEYLNELRPKTRAEALGSHYD